MSNGKGDTPRPLSVSQETFANNWDKVFGNQDCEYSGLPSVSSYGLDEEYTKLLQSGMFWEMFPGLTGNWEADKMRWGSISDTYKKRLYEK